ncbi:MAG: DUF86 domain-containing protein [Legionellaceae bacterium]|nr:DUF86 domain-containing protein [Legionellaceae bacterium]MBP9775092.1 DUF86 domain-containing protein [Legionellaceae bacterium]
MTKKDAMRIPDYLEHILEALKRIFHYVDDIDEVVFLTNELVQDAVLRNLEIIGEAANKLVHYHDEFIKQYSDVPWEDMYWMRNRISHGYFSIDFEIIWKTIEQDLPELKIQIQGIYQKIMAQSL